MSTEAKNIHLAAPLLAELEEAARSDHKTPDELVDEVTEHSCASAAGRIFSPTESRKALKAAFSKKTSQKSFISGVGSNTTPKKPR
jgi:hypothetical protein